MSQPNQPNPAPDDWLADFTDRVLDGKTSAPASPPDSDLRGLEETVLRLRQSLTQKALDEKTLKRMQTDFKARTRKAGSSSLLFWQFLQPRQRLVLAFAGAVLATLLIVFPFLTSITIPVEGTAGVQPQAILLLVGIVCILVLLIWVRSRK